MLVSDVVMPGLNGHELSQMLRLRSTEAPYAVSCQDTVSMRAVIRQGSMTSVPREAVRSDVISRAAFALILDAPRARPTERPHCEEARRLNPVGFDK